MKSKRFTKTDRLWLDTLLKLIKKTAKVRNDTAKVRCHKPGKNKKSFNPTAADILPRLSELFLMPNKGMDEEVLQGYTERINNLENVFCKKNSAKKKVSFADNTKGCGDMCSEKFLYSPHGDLKKINTNKRYIAKDMFLNQNIRKHNNNFNGEVMSSSSDYQSLITLGNRLDNLKKDSSNTDLIEGQRGPVNKGAERLTKPLDQQMEKIIPQYKLTKDNVRNIPTGLISEVKNVVPCDVGKMIGRYTRRKVFKSGPTCSKKKLSTNHCTRLGSHKVIDNSGKVSDNIPTATNTGGSNPEPLNIEEKTQPAINDIMTTYRDVPSRFGDNYKRITMFLEARKLTIPGKRQFGNEARGDLTIDDSLQDLESILQEKKRVGQKRTKLLNNKYYVERTALPKSNRHVSNSFKSIMVSKKDNIEEVGKVNSVKKKRGGKVKKTLSGCECYLKNMLKDREPYLNNLGLKGV